MNRVAQADVQRWSEEVARDPGSLAFVPLAQAYRRGGRRDAAIRLCLRGLERHPDHVEAHALLARLYLESGDRERARDEWAIALRLEPSHFEALRGLGFSALDRGDFAAAERLLREAASQRPDEPTVREGLRFAQARVAATPPPAAGAPPDLRSDHSPGAAMAERADIAESERAPFVPWTPEESMSATPAAEAEESPQPPAVERAGPPMPRDPGRAFESLAAEPLFRWALAVDDAGLPLAWTSARDDVSADELAAWIGALAAECARSAQHLKLGVWQTVLLETDEEVVNLARAGDAATVAFAAEAGAPAGWVLRAAARAAELASAHTEPA